MVMITHHCCNLQNYITLLHNIIHIYSGITSGRVLNGELLYTKILEVNLFAFDYRLFHEDFSPIVGDFMQKSTTIGEKSS